MVIGINKIGREIEGTTGNRLGAGARERQGKRRGMKKGRMTTSRARWDVESRERGVCNTGRARVGSRQRRGKGG
jgi:hypothetical protein